MYTELFMTLLQVLIASVFKEAGVMRANIRFNLNRLYVRVYVLFITL